MGIQGISNRLSFLLPVRSALQVDDVKCLSVKCVSMPIEARALVRVRRARAHYYGVTIGTGLYNTYSLRGQNLCKAFVGVFRLQFISRVSSMGFRRFMRSLNCFGNSKRREKSS